VTKPAVSYIVGSVPRSGSTLLCELLTHTGLAGAPAEFLSPYTVRVSKERWGVDTLDRYLAEVFARNSTPNGVFGTKAHWAQYHATVGDADPRALFPNLRFVYITRRDRLRQAVSWVRAQQTGKFHAQDPAEAQRSAVFDRDRIAQILQRIDREEGLWESLFERHALAPHRVVYEDFVEAQEDTVRAVLGLLGVEAPADLHIPPPALERQADELSDDWVERYLAETAST
jgi:LPS sulfotransferase NodH